MKTFLVSRNCLTCGKEFQARKDRNSRYCSSACWYSSSERKSMPKPIRRETRKCVVCGSEYQSLPSSPRQTCSYKCRCEYQSIIHKSQKFIDRVINLGHKNKGRKYYRKEPIQKTCEYCGKMFTVSRKSDKETREKKRFCSLSCWYNCIRQNPEKHGNWKGGEYEHNYGNNWGQQKKKARQRDNYTCQRCGKQSKGNGVNLDVHHKIPFRNFGIERYKEANDLSNLITLCRSCHVIVERNSSAIA